MKPIKIDPVTRQRLIEISREVNELNTLFKEIQNTYIRAKGGKGVYNLSQDGSELIPQEKKNDTPT